MGPILIVGAQREVREPLAELLEWEGFIPIPVASVDAALKLTETMAARPAVVLLALQASETGPSFLDERARRPAVAAVPVVVLAGPGVDAARLTTAQAVLPLPVDLAALVRAVEQLAAPPSEG